MSKQHQKGEGLCNNREELTGKKLPFGNCPFWEWNPGPSKLGPGHIPLSYHPVLRHLCNKGFTGLTCDGKKSPPCENFALLRHAAACCGMLQNPHQQLPESGAAACCGMLRHAAAVGGCLTPNRVRKLLRVWRGGGRWVGQSAAGVRAGGGGGVRGGRANIHTSK